MIKDLTVTMSPNTKPSWSGSINGSLIDPNVDVFSVNVPLATVGGVYEYVTLDLRIESYDNKDSSDVMLSGVPNVVYPIISPTLPSVIIPDKSLFDDDDVSDFDSGYSLIEAETFGKVFALLFKGTGWSIRAEQLLQNYPVVTETNPITTLNGTLFEQLIELIGILTPDNLWGQSLSVYLNIFTLEAIICPPQGSAEHPHNLAVDDVRPATLDVRIEKPIIPNKLIYQEQDTALFRSPEHTKYGEYNTEKYDFETTALIEEEDGGVTDIVARTNGTRSKIGNLTLTDTSKVIVEQKETAVIKYTWGANELNGGSDVKQQFSKNKSTDISVESEYSYLVGPPYKIEGAGLYSGDPFNKLYTKSLGGTRQQLARDEAPFRIDKDNYPSCLLTTDGIRVLTKKTVTKEGTISTMDFPGDSGREFPVMADIDPKYTVTTIHEVFGYDDEGNLITDRSETTVIKPDDTSTVTEKTKIITPVSGDLYAETVYTMVSNYNFEGVIIDSSVTDVTLQIVSGQQSGPTPVSSYSAVETTEVLREETIRNVGDVDITVLDTSGAKHTAKLATFGNVYTGVENLTLEEGKQYLEAYYNLTPKHAYYVSFESAHLDVRGIIGGSINLGVGSDNAPGIYDKNTMMGLEQFNTAVFDTPMRVTGIAMKWEEEAPPVVAVALCQLA